MTAPGGERGPGGFVAGGGDGRMASAGFQQRKGVVGRLDLGRTDPITFLPNRQQLDADQVYWTREPATLVLVTLADARAFNEILRALGHSRSEAFVRAGPSGCATSSGRAPRSTMSAC